MELELIERVWLLVVLTGALVLVALGELAPAGATVAIGAGATVVRWKRSPTENERRVESRRG